MSLGDYIRLVRTFLETFKPSKSGHAISASDMSVDESEQTETDDTHISRLHADLKVSVSLVCIYGCSLFVQEYDEQLARLGVKDDRIRHPLSTLTLVRRMIIRGIWSMFLFSICLPGLVLWTPIFLTTFYAVHEFKKTGYA
jgi:glycerol-3-phosphate O-acyltransferase/dihydroxyacetone phosphate acyltransferase